MHAIVLKEKGIVQVVKVICFGLWTNSSPDQGWKLRRNNLPILSFNEF